jgi:hypothetical protein
MLAAGAVSRGSSRLVVKVDGDAEPMEYFLYTPEVQASCSGLAVDLASRRLTSVVG